MRLIACTFALLLTVTVRAQQKETIYSWQSPSGAVAEAGGTIVQHNSLSVSRINFLSSGYYTIQLCGKKESMNATDSNLNSVYFTITLSDGSTFKAGDEIEITAMRNNDDGGNSNIYFLYGNGATYEDTSTWPNLGLMHEMSFDGGTSAKRSLPSEETGDVTGAGTEPLQDYSLAPGTTTFTVPTAADGSTTLSITRNESECMLYITKISVIRDIPTTVHSAEMTPSINRGVGDNASFTLSGQQINCNATKGIMIQGGRKILKR